MAEVTEEQRKLAAQWEAQQAAKAAAQQNQLQKQEVMQEEAKAVAKYLIDLEMRQRRTQLIIEQEGGKRAVVNCEYVTGTDLHFNVMSHGAQILKLCPTMDSAKPLNELKSIQDSCQLIMLLISLGVMNRIVPNRMQYSDPKDPGAKKPKSCEVLPMQHMAVHPNGFYIFTIQQSKVKTQLWLFALVGLAFFFLLFRVWPDWLKQGVWYLSWYTLVFLFSTAVVRAIVWFLIFHIGIDFWIFPNYFIDSDNILDSFWPLLELQRREDMFDLRMLILRICSAVAIFYGVQEFLKDPENLESMTNGGGELWDEMYDWGHHKFMGTVDPNQQIEVKKSARQIYAEAFMEEENPMFRSNTHFADYADEDQIKEMNERFAEEQKMTEEERAKAAFEDILSAEGEDDDEGEQIELDDAGEDVDLLDQLTGNFDDDDEEAAEQEQEPSETEKQKQIDEAREAEEAKAQAAADIKAEAEKKLKAEMERVEKLRAEEEAREQEKLQKELEKKKAEEDARRQAELKAKQEEEQKLKEEQIRKDEAEKAVKATEAKMAAEAAEAARIAEAKKAAEAAEAARIAEVKKAEEAKKAQEAAEAAKQAEEEAAKVESEKESSDL